MAIFYLTTSVKYLGTCIVDIREIRCTFEDAKLKFFLVINCIYICYTDWFSGLAIAIGPLTVVRVSVHVFVR